MNYIDQMPISLLFIEEAGASGMDWDQEENTTKLASKKEYDCVICNQTTPSSEDKPMGLVVLVQVMHLFVFMLIIEKHPIIFLSHKVILIF